MRVGIVGTGAMGRPLITRLVRGGFDVTAFARRTEVRRDLANEGVTCVDDVVALAQGPDVVVVYVYRDDQVREVLLDSGLADAMAGGTVAVVHTTASPRTMEVIDDRLRARGAGLVDAPGSGGPAQVAEGALTLFVGGADDQVAQCRPLFDAFANQVVHFGGVGSGQKVKLLNNLLFGAHAELALLASGLSEALGLDASLVAATLHTCSASSYALDLVAAMGSPGAMVEGIGPFVHKDVVVAQTVAAEIGADLGVLGLVAEAIVARTRR
jgi:3-hydroxyisobutyrate dehydrogenase-like beta-hydroxyacid dehydrogenase